ncbi:MAG TPA: hypothetical protein VF630_08520 [Hymenobacter sp.]|jgi:predicted Fe-S protein YdhL (DUF1289 family)
MLRLDKTVSRKTTLHADHDAEDRARWQTMTVNEKQEVLAYLRQQARCLHALREVGRQQDRSRNTADLANGETPN